MPPVVNDYIEHRHFPLKAFPEISVCLVTYENLHRPVFVGFATGLNIHSVYPALRTKIFLPHLQAAAAVNSDLQNVNLLATKATEMPFIDLKVMVEFPYPASSRVLIKIPEKVTVGMSRRRLNCTER